DDRESLFRHAARLQEAREIAACSQLRDAQLNRPGSCFPVAVTVAVALRKPQRGLLAITRAGRSPDFERHQLLGGKADHLAQQISVRTLLNKRAQVHHIIGHRWCPSGWLSTTRPYRKTPMAMKPSYTTCRDAIRDAIKTLHMDCRSQQNHCRRQTWAPSVRFHPLEKYLFWQA